MQKIGRGVLFVFSGFHFLVFCQVSIFLSKSWFWNFCAYFMPFFIVIELLLLIFLLLRRNYLLSLIPLFVLVFSWSSISDTIQFNGVSCHSTDQSLKVLSYNVALIPYENKSDSASLDTTASNEFFELLEKESPDILCLQEFHHEDFEDMDLLNKLNVQFGYEYYVMNPVFLDRFRGYSGPIVLSKYPIVNDYHHKFKEGENDINHLIAVDILYQQDTVRVVNVHLKSMTIRLSASRFKFVENGINIYNRLKTGFQTQKTQVVEAYEYVKDSPHPLVFCGDFNSLPYSYIYQYLNERLKNTFDEKGKGFGYTLNRFPYFVRIDNVFVSQEIEVCSHQVLRQHKKSDHYPILVKLRIKSR